MKKLFLATLLLPLTLSVSAQGIASSNCAFARAAEVIHGNQIRTNIYPQGYFFQGRFGGSFQVPFFGPKSPSTFYSAALWIAAHDDGGNLKLVANTYAIGGRGEFWPGPLSDVGAIDSTQCATWDTLWSVQQFEIVRHLQDYDKDGVVDDKISSIFGWPGKGNIYFEEINGFELPDQDGLSAPFFDKNGNGVYDPQLGEYPHPKGVHFETIVSQIMWCVYNDEGDIHANSQGDPLGIDVQQTIYAFQCADQSVLNYTLFNSFRVRNRSISSLNDLIFGQWMDYDLGCHTDDFLGSNPEANSAFTYNEDNIDGTTGTNCPSTSGAIPTYGRNPPVQSTTFLNHEMTAATAYVNAGVGNGGQDVDKPEVPQDFYNMLSGFWTDGSPMYTKGVGYMTDTVETSKYIYNGDPRDSMSWAQTNFIPFIADKRMIISSELGDLEVGQYIDVDLAYTFHRDTSFDNLENVGLMYEQVDQLQEQYDAQFEGLCDISFVECDDDCVYPGDANHDGIVNNCDYLELTAAFENIGTTRNPPLSWNPHYSMNWDASSPQGYNLKHSDCNADGVTNLSDVDFVDFYYGYKNEYYNSSPVPNEFGDDIRLILSDSVWEYNNPTFLRVDVIIDNVNHDSIMGITFTVEFDTEILDIIQKNAIPLFPSDNLLSRMSELDGKTSYTWSRTDNTNQAIDSTLLVEYVMHIRWNTVPSDTMSTTSIKITNVKGILANGELLDLKGDSLDLVFLPVTVATNDISSNSIKVFPNPSEGTIYIEGDHILPDSEYMLIDINGRLAASGKTDGLTIDVDVPPGIYVLSLLGEYPARALVVIQK